MGLLWPTLSAASTPQSFATLLREADDVRTSDPAQFKRLLDELDRLAAKATPAERTQLRFLHAYRSILKGDSQGAIRELKSLLGVTTDVETRYRAGALLANTYVLTREYTESLAVLERTLLLQEQIENRDSYHQGLLAASIVYNAVGEYVLGRSYAEQVLADRENGRSQCIAGNLRLEALQGIGTAQDNASYMAAIQRCEAINESVAAGLARSYLARKWYAESKVAEATSLLETYLPEVEATGYRYLIGEYHSLIAQFRMTSGDIMSAERHAAAAIRTHPDDANGLALVRAYKTLYEIAERRGDPVAALAFYKRYAVADKGNLNEIKARETAYQLVRQQTQQKSQQIELLNQQNQVLQLRQRVSEQSVQNSRLLVALLAVLLASIGYWAYRIKRGQHLLRQQAQTDALTGVCNRHHFTLLSEQTLAQCAKSGDRAALVMFDLDHFKDVNDSYGHVTGDWALKAVADTCKAFCRQIDHLGRLGGEEFAILLRGYDLHVATRVAEDCRARIARIDTSESGHRFAVTASFGVASTTLSGYDLAGLMAHADKMLYRAKREGRNRVCAYSREMAQAPEAPETGSRIRFASVD